MAQTQPALSVKLGMAIAEANATGQVTRVNAYAYALDALGGTAAVKDKDLTTPPALTNSGHGYIVPAGASGEWATKSKYLAYDYNSAWLYFAPWKGATVYVEDEDKDYKYDGTNWVIKTAQSSAALSLAGVTKTADFTASVSEAGVYLLDGTSANLVVGIPAAASIANRGWYFKRVDASAHSVTLDPNGSETIDGQTTWSLPSQYDCVLLWSDGSSLFIL